MPRYFFDIDADDAMRDTDGTDCASDEEVRRLAMRALPDIARDEIPNDGDRRHFTVVARDEAGQAVYAATLSYAGLWLRKRP